jgi:DNA polymerase sigma
MARALELIDQTLELYHPHGLISKILILKARVPLIKLNYEQQIGHPRATSIDCVINNYFGIENSKILRKYSKNQQIMKFCNLIKLWALRNQVINKQNVQLSLTGYGIVLMSLYFLIVHKQIGCVVRKNERYELSKFEVNIKSLLSNIKGFLHFYSRDGSFFKEKQIVCLLGKEEAMKYSYVYKEDLLINMYDFIDGTNPGRMPKAFSQ